MRGKPVPKGGRLVERFPLAKEGEDGTVAKEDRVVEAIPAPLAVFGEVVDPFGCGGTGFEGGEEDRPAGRIFLDGAGGEEEGTAPGQAVNGGAEGEPIGAASEGEDAEVEGLEVGEGVGIAVEGGLGGFEEIGAEGIGEGVGLFEEGGGEDGGFEGLSGIGVDRVETLPAGEVAGLEDTLDIAIGALGEEGGQLPAVFVGEEGGEDGGFVGIQEIGLVEEFLIKRGGAAGPAVERAGLEEFAALTAEGFGSGRIGIFEEGEERLCGPGAAAGEVIGGVVGGLGGVGGGGLEDERGDGAEIDGDIHAQPNGGGGDEQAQADAGPAVAALGGGRD